MFVKNIFYFFLFFSIKSKNDNSEKELYTNFMIQYIKNVCLKGMVECNFEFLKDFGISIYLSVYDEEFCTISSFDYGVFFNGFNLPFVGGIYTSVLFHFSTEIKEFGFNIYKLNIEGMKIFLMKKVHDFKFGFIFFLNEQGMSIYGCFSYNIFCSRYLLISGYGGLSLLKKCKSEYLKSLFCYDSKKSNVEFEHGHFNDFNKHVDESELKLRENLNMENEVVYNPVLEFEAEFNFLLKPKAKFNFDELQMRYKNEVFSNTELNSAFTSDDKPKINFDETQKRYKIHLDTNELECVYDSYNYYYDMNNFSNANKYIIKDCICDENWQKINEIVDEIVINKLAMSYAINESFFNEPETESCYENARIFDFYSHEYSDVNNITANENVVSACINGTIQKFILNNVENVNGLINLLKSGFADKNNINHLTNSKIKIESILVYENKFSEGVIFKLYDTDDSNKYEIISLY